MKKIIMLSLIASITSINVFSMLLQRARHHALYKQKHIRIYRMKSLGSETIFNTANCDTRHQLELLDNLHDRNDKVVRDLEGQIKLLKQQNSIANSASHSFKLDKDKLNHLEIQLYEGFNNLNEES